MVDDVSAEVLFRDHVLLNRLQRSWAEVGGFRGTVQMPNRPDRLLHTFQFFGGFAVLRVIRLGELPVSK
jgi:hypothetical protein